jgi:hypothetical protein
VRWFGFANGRFAGPVELDYPLVGEQVEEATGALRELASRPLPEGPEALRAARLRMGLVARQLLSSKRRKGVMMRWDESTEPAELIRRVEEAPEAVGVRRRRAKATKPGGPGANGGQAGASERASGRD